MIAWRIKKIKPHDINPMPESSIICGRMSPCKIWCAVKVLYAEIFFRNTAIFIAPVVAIALPDKTSMAQAEIVFRSLDGMCLFLELSSFVFMFNFNFLFCWDIWHKVICSFADLISATREQRNTITCRGIDIRCVPRV